MLRSTTCWWFLALVCITAARFNCVPKSIPEAAKACCGTEADCCVKRLVANSTVTGCFGEHIWRPHAACLEKAFHCESMIEENPDECCWLLYSRQCREACLLNFRKPTLSVEEKLNFLHLCPLDQHGQIPFHRRRDECGSEDVDACAHKRQELHNCYPKCLRLVKDFPNAFEDLTSAAEICQVDVDDTDIGRGNSKRYALIAFYEIRKGKDLSAEGKKTMQGVPGATGSMKWTLARRAQGWQVLLQEGAFAEPAKRRCDVTFVDDDVALLLPESPSYFYIRVLLFNPQSGKAQELFPIIVSRYTLRRPTDRLLYPLFNATDAELTLVALPFNTSGEVENFSQFAMLEETAKIARLEEERDKQALQPATHKLTCSEAERAFLDVLKQKPSDWMDNIKTWFFYTTACGVTVALVITLLSLYGAVLSEVLKRLVQGVRNKATMIVEG